MGLAGRKDKRKLAVDPNNTKWSRNETTFGQRMLRKNGWVPGQNLGAQDSAHAEFHTAASAAPIKVVLKDDFLGLGAKVRQKQSDECTGLDVFKDLLGRLNGVSEEVIEKDKKRREVIKTNMYVEQKFGLMRFVSGGLLVGDQMQNLIKEDSVKKEEEEDVKIKEESESSESEEEKPAKKEKKSKKRKAEEESDGPSKKKSKKSKKSKSSSAESHDSDNDSSAKSKDKKKEKKERKREKKLREAEASAAQSAATSDADEDAEKRRKREKKEEKKRRKEAEKNSSASATPMDVDTPAVSGTATPVTSGTSTPMAMSARHYARSRNIAQKRAAAADMKSLNQIFMVKPV